MSLARKSLNQSDETRTFPNGQGSVVTLEGMTIGRGVMQPGWRWSNDIKPMAGTDSCEVLHTGYLIAGELHVEANDGTALDIRTGDVFVIAPGHDAWVVGEETVVMVEWSGSSKAMFEQVPA
jgi:hypothetical protein